MPFSAGGNSLFAPTYSVYASGTAYTLTASSAGVDFGTTDPIITITLPGTYLIMAEARIEYVGATFAASRVITNKLRRTNNSAADLAGSPTTFNTQIITTQSFTAGTVSIPPVYYTTSNTNDTIQIFSDVSVLPSAGTVQIAEASIVALRVG